MALSAAPAGALSSASGTAGSRYLVQRGDTLSAIAARYGVSVSALAQANGIADANTIYAGRYLTIPSGSGGVSTGGGSTYLVRSGDTLSAIAARYGVSVSALAQANGIADANTIYAGRHLTIPGAGSTASPAAATVGVGVPAKLAADPSRYSSYNPLFEHWAAAYGLSPSLLKGLCWLESGWHSAVVSSTGAIGMCQFMPNTTRFVSQDLIGATMNPWNPNDNIHMSAAYLRHLLDASGGNVRTAVASYYQGFDSVTSRGMYNDTIAYVEGVLAFQQRF